MTTPAPRFGTSSWTARGWEKTFYPSGLRPIDYLEFYSREFDTVEADVTYYRIPGPDMVARWNDVTPDDFLLSAKFPRSIVHAGDGARPDPDRVLAPAHIAQDTARFLDAMRPMRDKIGALVLQFPYFNRTTFQGPGPFLERLDRYLENLPSDYRYAVEIRNSRWIDHQFIEVLRHHGVARVLVDLPYMPDPEELRDVDSLVTTDFSYLRLIGNRKEVEAKAKTFDAVVIDHGERLSRWTEVIHSVVERVPRLFIYANNHFAGHAPDTIRDLQSRVGA